jgi:hypothetical protein
MFMFYTQKWYQCMDISGAPFTSQHFIITSRPGVYLAVAVALIKGNKEWMTVLNMTVASKL